MTTLARPIAYLACAASFLGIAIGIPSLWAGSLVVAVLVAEVGHRAGRAA